MQYWRESGRPEKNVVLARRLSYHGITLGALSLSGHATRRRHFEPLLTQNAVVEPPHCYRCPLGKTYPACDLACADDLERHISGSAPTGWPLSWWSRLSARPAAPSCLRRTTSRVIREICDRHEVLLIADEVMTAMGRTGRMFGMEHWGVEPDLITFGKGLSAGYTPLAAALASDRLVQTIRRGSGVIMSGHTYSGNPLSCAVGLAVVRYVLAHQLVERAAAAEVGMRDRLEALQRRHPIIGDVRGLGLMWGLELVEDPATRTPFLPSDRMAARLAAAAQDHGLLIYPALAGADDRAGDAVMIAPPLTSSDVELDLLCDLLDTALQTVEKEL